MEEQLILYSETLADVRDILLPLVDAEDKENLCGDMVGCTTSSPECVKCLAKQIVKQYKSK